MADYELHGDTSVHIITDLRFQNEYKSLKDQGFKLIRVKRENHLISNDVSETEQDLIPDSGFDFIIENDNDIKFLDDESEKIVNTILDIK